MPPLFLYALHIKVGFTEELGGLELVGLFEVNTLHAASVGVKSLAVCPQIHPVAISAILAAGTRQSIFSFTSVHKNLLTLSEVTF